MKIILASVNASYVHTNLAIRCLRHALEQQGHTVVLWEKNLRDRPSYILEELYDISGDASLLGFSTYIWNLEMTLSLARELKTLRPELPIFLGGPEVSFDTERFENLTYIDSILCGEGEVNVLRIAEDCQNRKPLPKIYREVLPEHVMQDEGILYRADDVPAGSIVYYESSRGCPYNCAYCLSSCTDRIRYKPCEQVFSDLREFESLPDRIKVVKFVDRTFNFPLDRAKAIWRELLKDIYTRHYHFEVCANLLDDEAISILERFPKGKIQLEFGLQSTNPQTLDAVARHIDSRAVLDRVAQIHAFGNIHVHLDLIAGLPYETYERFRQSFDDAFDACDMLQVGFLKLLHGTRLRRDAEQYGYIYQNTPPYTVYANRWIRYEELCSLERIAEVVKRYHESGRFENSLAFIRPYLSSPFDFFAGLSDACRARGLHIRQVSQPDAYEIMRDVGLTYLRDDDTLKRAFLSALRTDFSYAEVHRVPFFLTDNSLR